MLTIKTNNKKQEVICVEKVYKAMKSVGSFNVVLGILMIVSGIAFGVLIIAKGAKLLKHKSDILF